VSLGTGRLASVTLACCFLGTLPAVCASQEQPANAPASAGRPEIMVLRVLLNTESKGDFFIGRTPDNDFLVKADDLKAMGLTEPAGTLVTLEGEPHLSLRSISGVSFVFDKRALVLRLIAEPRLLPGQQLDLQAEGRARGEIPKSSSLFFNYALNAARDDSMSATATGLAAEMGWHVGDYLLLANGSSVPTANGQRKFVRLMSSVTRDDRDRLEQIVIGDFYTPAREFSTGVNLGGISISRLYGLNPYFTPFPMQSIKGNAALPSEAEVYLDGQRIRSEKLKPGEFELRNLLAYGGARDIRVVLRDAFGREEQLNYSFYFSDQPLRQGLQEYSYSLGALRRDYGEQSNHYGPAAFSMFHRYGLTDAVTLGLRAEGTGGFYNAGPLATVVLGSAGVVNLALAGSSMGSQRGTAASMTYNYQSRRWSLGLSMRRDRGSYAALGDPPVMNNRKAESSVTASYFLPGRGTLSLSHSALSTRGALAASNATPAQPFNALPLESRRVSTLGYSTSLVSGRVSLQASLSRINALQSRTEAFIGLFFFFGGNFSVAANYRGNPDDHSASLLLTKNQPIGEGLGYVVSSDRAASATAASTQFNARAQYNAPFALLQGEFGRSREAGKTAASYRASLAGGIAYVDGEVAFGRPVSDSFGIVKVGKLPGVAVAVNGQPIGTTDAQGKVFIPTLTPYFDNDVSIESESVPIDYAIPATVKKISPALRSGAVIDFGLSKIQAFSGKLKTGAGEAVKYQEISLSVDGRPQSLQTGRGGEFYVENLKPGTYPAVVRSKDASCRFDLRIPQSEETFVELGDVVCRPAP
jgi:outer membrane usher protein FimD/PapC